MPLGNRRARDEPAIAIVHDYFVDFGGAERVATWMTQLFPTAPLFTSAVRPGLLPPEISPSRVTTSFLQPFGRRKVTLQAVFPLIPLAFRSFRIGQPDIVLSSSSGFAHHVGSPPHATHICYCHTPPRFLWQPSEYFRGSHAGRAVLRPVIRALRALDLAAARRVHVYVANSRFVAARIREVYGRSSQVIYPPVDVQSFSAESSTSGRFLVLSRLLSYKRIDLAIHAANLSRSPLDVVGDGPERRRLEAIAGPMVRFLGRQPDVAVKKLLATCVALLVPGTEDFGLTIVEAQASGRPPIAYGNGGALETVVDGQTGFLFASQTADALVAAMTRARTEHLASGDLRTWAMRFDVSVFQDQLGALISSASRRTS